MGIINEVKSHKYRAWKSCVTSLLFTTLGLHSASFGPSLIDLMVQVNTTIDQITHILPTRAFGNMIGTTLCGFLLGWFDHQVVLIFSSLSMSLSIIAVPFCTSLTQLYFAMAWNGMSGGFLVNSGNCWVINAWGREMESFMQVLHFCFGIGAFFSPMIIEPFLKVKADEHDLKSTLTTNFPMNITTTNSTFDNTFNMTDSFPDVLKKPITSDADQLELKYAYLIIGSISLFIWSLYVITWFNQKTNKPHPTRQIKEKKSNETVIKVEILTLEEIDLKEKNNDSLAIANNKEKEALETEKKPERYHKFMIVLFSALFIHTAYGLELSFGVMLASYARLSALHFDKTSASFVTSCYWACFTFFRLITVVLINFISSRSMLIIDLVLIMLSNCILLPFGGTYPWALWLGSILMGLGVSSIYPSLWGFLEPVVPVTSKMTSAINSCACIGEFIVPVIIGAYIQTDPDVFLYIVFLYSSLACIFFSLCCLAEFIILKYKRS